MYKLTGFEKYTGRRVIVGTLFQTERQAMLWAERFMMVDIKIENVEDKQER